MFKNMTRQLFARLNRHLPHRLVHRDPLPNAQTVASTPIILYMNEKACRTFAGHGNLIGRNLFDCHSPKSQEKIRELLETGGVNAYTIEKKGVRKMIYQTAWKREGVVCGLVEISMEIPGEMPHYIRE